MAQTFPLAGSRRAEVPDATLVGPSEPSQKIAVSVYLRRNPDQLLAAAATSEALSAPSPLEREYLSREQIAAVYGASQADVDAVTGWAKANGLAVKSDAAESLRSRRVLVEGTIGDVQRAFGVSLKEYAHPAHGRYRGRSGDVLLPEQLHGVVEGVFGLDTRRVGHGRRHSLPVRARLTERATTAPWQGTFFPPQVAALYSYPPDLDGTGQNVAVLAFNGQGPAPNGGYRPDLLQRYFQSLGLPPPAITDVVVQGPGNQPGPDTQASGQQGDTTGEIMLDLCVVGSVAPGAKIFVYFTEFTTQGWIDAINRIVTDDNDCSVISISYGNPEDDPQGAWTSMGVNAVNQAFEAAIARGITICAASGDDGSRDQARTGAHADFPASSPFVLSVGGTKLVADGSTQIASEVVWNELPARGGAGGGGISALFTRPSYQDHVNVPSSAMAPHKIGRGVPDVAAVADPRTGVVVMHIAGDVQPVGGTSAAAPLWAALVARLNQGLGARCGFLNPTLYAKASVGVLYDITRGNNGAYTAAVGWDPCTGLGTPNGQKLLAALRT